MPSSAALPASTDAVRAVPRLALIGGRLEPGNAAVYAALREMCGGRIAVFATASLIPEQAGADTVADFALHGVAAASGLRSTPRRSARTGAIARGEPT